ncbi:MAG TPA: response regulator transcription factor [Micromonosporaceae bacterium]|jgi:DNA-binding NarL/FixJ family response regulator|nr:response regulator transcription factor [Micromonosporaceae bacterium]
MTLTVVAIADSALVRVGIAAAIAAHADLRLAATAGSMAEAQPLVSRLRPDVTLVDNELADGEGLAYAAQLRRGRPDLGLVLIAPRSDDLLFRALDAGISAYVPRSAPVEEVLAAIRHAAAAPASFIAPDLAAALVRRRQQASALSPREVEVLRLLVDGLSAQRISSTLRVSESTVKTYLGRVYDKLGVRTRAEAMDAAGQLGLV